MEYIEHLAVLNAFYLNGDIETIDINPDVMPSIMFLSQNGYIEFNLNNSKTRITTLGILYLGDINNFLLGGYFTHE